MILRDFELAGLAAKRAIVERVAAEIRAAEPRARVEVSFREQYRNMRYWLEKDMRPVDYALEAVRRAGLSPISSAIRGGTDGSQLTARGLPTPNIFCGMHEVHSQREWVSLQDMARAAHVLIHLAQIWEERSGA
jgi:tripeptide aminopeptidase